jgi:hypothetical protein
MRKDVREFIRRREAVGVTVEPTPGHYRVRHAGKSLRKANAVPFMLVFSPATIHWRRRAIVEFAQARHRPVARSAAPAPTPPIAPVTRIVFGFRRRSPARGRRGSLTGIKGGTGLLVSMPTSWPRWSALLAEFPAIGESR